MTDGLKDKYRKAIIDILRANERVEKVVLFGSRAMGTFTPTSDVDIALFGDNLTLTDHANLAAVIDELSIPQRVDILLHKSIKNEKLIKHIKRHGVEWYRRSWAMASEWTPTTVGSFCPFTYGKGLPEKKRNTNGNIKVYGSNGPVGVHDQPLVDEPGIVIGRKGSVGAVHFASEPFWPIDTTFYVVSEADRDLNYTYYLLKSIGLENMNADSAVSGLNRDAAHARQILVPSYDEQRTIAHILGSLDDKIELNRRMNEMLEAMARAIFKSWFVNFDPVRAKAEGRDPLSACGHAQAGGLPDEIAALFPDSFEDSDLGEIPKGWEVKPLDDIALLKTQTIQPKNFADKIWEHYSIPAFDEGRQPVCEAGKDIKSGKYAVPENCVLASKLNPQFPRVWLPDVQNADSAICSTEFMPFVPNIKGCRPFLYEMLQSHPVQSEISSRVTGSTGSRQRVKPKEIAMMPCLVPPKDVVDTFCDQVGLLHDNQLSNIRQSATLASLRDTLLPKLISGELRLPAAALEELAAQAGVLDAEKFAEPACAMHTDREAGA